MAASMSGRTIVLTATTDVTTGVGSKLRVACVTIENGTTAGLCTIHINGTAGPIIYTASPATSAASIIFAPGTPVDVDEVNVTALSATTKVNVFLVN